MCSHHFIKSHAPAWWRHQIETFSALLPFVRESTGDWWIPFTKAHDGELWCLLWSTPEQTVEQTIDTPVIWDAIVLIIASMKCNHRIIFGFNICYCSINMSVRPGSLVAVVGSVGAGKSTLLSAILGETEKISGQVNVNVSIGDDNKTICITNQCLSRPYAKWYMGLMNKWSTTIWSICYR